jgi:hypothetical protein
VSWRDVVGAADGWRHELQRQRHGAGAVVLVKLLLALHELLRAGLADARVRHLLIDASRRVSDVALQVLPKTLGAER